MLFRKGQEFPKPHDTNLSTSSFLTTTDTPGDDNFKEIVTENAGSFQNSSTYGINANEADFVNFVEYKPLSTGEFYCHRTKIFALFTSK